MYPLVNSVKIIAALVAPVVKILTSPVRVFGLNFDRTNQGEQGHAAGL